MHPGAIFAIVFVLIILVVGGILLAGFFLGWFDSEEADKKEDTTPPAGTPGGTPTETPVVDPLLKFKLGSNKYGMELNNDKTVMATSPTQCAQFCLDEKGFDCRSFDYNTNGECLLSKSAMIDPNKKYNTTLTGFSYYEKLGITAKESFRGSPLEDLFAH